MLAISKNVPSKCLYGASDVILWILHQGMKHLNGASDIVTMVRFSKLQTGPPCFIHLGWKLLSFLGIFEGF